jgi:hypothetical protein
MLSHLRLIPLLLGLVVGAIILYVYKPQKQIIYQYPHPEDSKDKIFKDKNNTCYKYSTHEVNCDAHEKSLKDYPLQA